MKKLEEALWLADQLGLDLVEVAPEARPPVCRLMDYGKWKYEQSVKEREARKKSTRTVIKEVKFRPKIDKHDFETKKRKVIEFLDEGDKVKVTMMFRGREVTHPEIGEALLKRLTEEVADHGKLETFPKLEGRNMTMTLGPVKRPKPKPEAEPAPAAEAEAEVAVEIETEIEAQTEPVQEAAVADEN